MQPDHSSWEGWARTLQHWGVHEIAAALLEAAGPMTIFFAQVVYIGQPLLRGIYPEKKVRDLALLFDNPAESLQFAHYLREDRVA